MGKEFTLTKEEFIQRSMKGEVFIHKNERYFYDEAKQSPFRLDEEALQACWCNMNGKTLFTLEEPKPIIERRWRWLKDYEEGVTNVSSYRTDENALKQGFIQNGWYKKEDDYIDVKVKQ